MIDSAIETTLHPKDRILVALDVSTAAAAREIVAELGDSVGGFKIGLQLFSATGPAFVSELVTAGNKIFLDLKFHDIPNTVAKASVEAARLGVWMFNVHASGGREMMIRSANEVRFFCEREGLATPKMIAVTVLTSSDDNVLAEIGIESPVSEQVVRLTKLTNECGLDGVVASPREVVAVRQVVDNDKFLLVTPGIRPVSATKDDQERVTTFRQALANGSDYVVIGRPITGSENKLAALAQILAEIDN